MNGKLPYESPTLSRWGSISDLTQGQGMTLSSDDFETCPPEQSDMDAFIGSNDNDTNAC